MNVSPPSRNTLYLASSSQSRQLLLKQAGIPFMVIKQDADERSIDWSMPPGELVTVLALLKINHAQIPEISQENPATTIPAITIYVLTADTVTCDSKGAIYGKPRDKQEARGMIQALSYGSKVYTGFCLDKRVIIDNKWHIQERIVKVVEASCTCIVPDKWLERYVEEPGVLEASGALIVDDFGALFVKDIQGSYTGIIGLPLFEVREALDELGFFD